MNVLFSLFVFVVANYLRINDISNNYKGVWDILFSLLFTNFAKSKKGEAMEKENIMTVDIEDFKKSQHILDYIDDAYADEILAVVRKARVDGIDIESALRNRLRDVEEKVALIESEINND